jgi:hypothetical protein
MAVMTGSPSSAFTNGIVAPGLTANRTSMLPDFSGIIPTSSYQNSAYDNFNRANGGLGSNWTAATGGPFLISANVVPAPGGTVVANWNANTFAADQFSEVTMPVVGTAFGGPAVRISGSNNWYSCLESTSGNLMTIQKNVNGSLTSLVNTGITPANGDLVRAEVAGTTITCRQNGAVINSTSDSSLASGSPGMDVQSTAATFDNWSGGNLHPIAQLDTEQDWTQPQHFISPITLGNPAPVAGTLVQGNVGTAVVNIASGTATMTTAAIAGGACGTTVTVAGAGITTADAITWSFAASVGINPGELNVTQWPTAGNVNFQYCNETGASVTPTATTINWRVTR